uniref:Ig-like domain-containing protein n=1 Tax=Malurus cyaneus samueli TaxID=2593467 RepID=A0A8C5TXW8_9PASS
MNGSTHTLKIKHRPIFYFCLTHFSPLCTFPGLPALFKQWLKNEEVEEGRTAMLRCELTQPHARVEWRKGDTVLQPGDKYEFRQEGTRVELLIYEAEAQDAGDYTCDSGDQQTTASLQVKEIKQQECPVFTETFKDFSGEPGSTLHLECVAHSKTDMNVRWLKDGKDDGTCSLIITGLDRKDAGKYTCEASNKFGKDAFPVVKEIKLPLWYYPIFYNISLVYTVCFIMKVLTSPIFCFPDGIPIQSSSRILISSTLKHFQLLTILSVTAEDFGIYTCVATNSLGWSAAGLETCGNQHPCPLHCPVQE